MRGRDGNGTGFGIPAIDEAVDRLVDRAGAAMDRVAAAVERGVDRIGRGVNAGGAGAGPEPAAATAADDGGKREPQGAAGQSEGADADAGGPGPRPGYGGFVDATREKVSGIAARGLGGLDDRLGDAPWRAAGLDERRTRIARGVMREVVPEVAGDRVASVVDGAALKGGVAGAGLLLRIPLKGFAAPFLLGIAAVEAVRAVREVRVRVADVAARVDNEARSRAAYDAPPA